TKIDKLLNKQSYIHHIPDTLVADLVSDNRFLPTTDFSKIADADIVIMCVPTPLSKYRDPDMSYVVKTTETIAKYLRKDQLIILESTTYPGTSNELMKPIFEATGLKAGVDFFMGYSPEREDPGNPNFSTVKIPKVVGGLNAESLALTKAVYDSFNIATVPVSSLETAEAIKLTENIFRSVNIALVNELKCVYEAMGIDIWEVIDAAKTKPFGYMPFYPGPGLGGHCIPIDPFYLTWKAREFGLSTKFIELAGEINTSMPFYVMGKLSDALDSRFQKPIKGTRILIVGIAYKKNVDDARESPAFLIMDHLRSRGALLDYYDPFIPEILPMREHPDLVGMKSIPFTESMLKNYDAAMIVTDHDGVDYAQIVNYTSVTIDCRNATKDIEDSILREKIVKA
ncbi:MAG: nucleotide sugar dehydrogenase, partial [Alphaproteobacteria bacterium]|nr:nucleotide sugar dehydrogenase [Alphaproteobacteria bacterium]